MSTETTALAVIDHGALAVSRPPDEVLEEARKAAAALKHVIDNKKKKVVFNGETYLENEDWLTVARFYGVTSRIRSTKFIEYGEDEFKARGFEAIAEAYLVGTDQVISAAESMCLDDEPNWRRKPLFQLKSMAQTRASSRVLRQVFGWVVVLAGYKATPAEEMGSDEQPQSNSGIKRTARKSEPVEGTYIQQDEIDPFVAEQTNGNGHSRLITEPQAKRLFAIAKQKGVGNDKLRTILASNGFEHSHEITKDAYNKIVAEVEQTA